jgi:hypothetical protein
VCGRSFVPHARQLRSSRSRQILQET